MKILLSNEIAKNYDLGSVIFKKDYKRNLIIFMKITSVSYYGFKQSKTHTKFGGYIVRKESLKEKSI
jgi:hypothetical protein